MSPSVIGFIRVSLISLLVGVVMGVLMAAGVFSGACRPGFITTAHAHINLLGFVCMLIFGGGYHILPRFSGKPLYSERLASVQLWLNTAGLVGVFAMLVAAAYSEADLMRYGVAPFGAVFALGAVLFTFNLLKTMGRAPAPPVVPPKPAARP
jgi:cbb3-type cytochrome oxidase subunit 1